MKCTQCQAELLPDARFCAQCATPNPLFQSVQPPKPALSAGLPKPKLQAGLSAGLRPAGLTAAPAGASLGVGNVMVERFAKFWAKGVSGSFQCWSHSNQSLDEAQRQADQRVAEIAARFKQFGEPPKKYIYSDRKLREPVIEALHQSVISRNAYGALVLNTAHAMFVDIDLPNPSSGGFLKGLFGGSRSDPRQDILQRVQAWTERTPGWGWRVYDTAAGMRLLATHQVFEPDAEVVQNVFEELGADPLYRVLCRVQKCFRARLTPKPWRCDLAAPKVRWPWANPQEEVEFADWLSQYERHSAGCATTHWVTDLGATEVHPAVAPIVALHDERTLALRGDLPLA